jgi:D-3-phosphoglycerate dehydrogenase / 2-oxoglutarate reductase
LNARRQRQPECWPKMKILIAETKDFSQEALTILRGFSDVYLIDIQKDSLQKALEEYDVFWFRLGFRVRAEDLPENPRCRHIVCPVTGLDHIDLEACAAKGIRVLSLRGEVDFLKNVRATAELTIGLSLALLRKIPQAYGHVLAGDWARDEFRGQELLGKTVGIVGMGRLGKITAQLFRAFGCQVLGYDLRPFEEEGVTACESLDVLVKNADLVSLHLNYLPENQHLFDDALFSKFKKGNLLVNTARGGIVDGHALLRHLENGHLAGAALDVIEDEHEHRSSPLIAYARSHDNLLITPHIGGNTSESFAKTEVFMAEKCKMEVKPHSLVS